MLRHLILYPLCRLPGSRIWYTLMSTLRTRTVHVHEGILEFRLSMHWLVQLFVRMHGQKRGGSGLPPCSAPQETDGVVLDEDGVKSTTLLCQDNKTAPALAKSWLFNLLVVEFGQHS